MKNKFYKKMLDTVEVDMSSGRRFMSFTNMLISGMLIGYSIGHSITSVNQEVASIGLIIFTSLSVLWFLLFLTYMQKTYRFFTYIKYTLPNGNECLMEIQGIAIKKINQSGFKYNEEIKAKMEDLIPKIIEEKAKEVSKIYEMLDNTFYLQMDPHIVSWAKLYDAKGIATTETVILLNSIFKELNKNFPEARFVKIISLK